jgi:ribosomal protein L9
MDNALEQIRYKITQFKAQLFALQTTERELAKLEKRQMREAEAAPKRGRKPGSNASPQPVMKIAPAKTQTMGAAVTEALKGHDPLTVGEIAEMITATGRPVDNRAISFALQALKKRGLVKGAGGKWTVPKTRGRKAAFS